MTRAMTTRELARAATAVENGAPLPIGLPEGDGLIVGVTGPPGAGKSSLVDSLTAELRRRNKKVAIIAVDPTSRATGGAILGDRIRMQRHHSDSGVFIRSMATRGAAGGIAQTSATLARLFRGAGFDFIFVETVGVGQDEVRIASHADVTVVVLTPGMGDDVQAIKAGIMEIADIFVINKADRPGADQTEREIEGMLSLGSDDIPIFRTVAVEGTGIAELCSVLEARGCKIPAAGELAWEVDHLAIAVQSIDEALPFYESQLGVKLLAREIVRHENVHTAMLAVGSARIELLEPLHPESSVARFLRRRGPGIHHVAMRVPDLDALVRRLESAGVRLLGAPQTGAGGHRYVFVHPESAGGVLWELIQA
ncbi:MAG: methylmalonyl Co-A mutase-associated GTPase MeaB [Acidobacteriota bacterium]|nr:methylmalonyl Co-A mutase-associated GTPase MeaB [Acidobacteriota bacterium]